MWLLFIYRSLACSHRSFIRNIFLICFIFYLIVLMYTYIDHICTVFISSLSYLCEKSKADFNVYTRINIRLVSTSLNLVARNSDVIYNQIPFSLRNFTLISLYLFDCLPVPNQTT